MDERGIFNRIEYGHIEINVRALMREKGYNRNQLAKLIGVRFDVVDRWQEGKVERMDLDILARLCHVFQCQVEDVIHYVGPPKA